MPCNVKHVSKKTRPSMYRRNLVCSLAVLLLAACIVSSAPSRRKPGRAKPMRDRSKEHENRRVRFIITNESVIDLTYNFDASSAYWPSQPQGFVLEEIFRGFNEDPRYFYSLNRYSQVEHLGTHMDAPLHFYEQGISVEKVNLLRLMERGVLVNLKQGNEKIDRDSEVTLENLRNWERANRRIPPKSIVLLYTGFGDVYYDRPEYFGTNLTGPESVPYLRFPGLHPDAAEWLVKYRRISAIGIDTASMDHAQTKDFKSHQILTKAGVIIFENVANLDRLAAQNKRFTVIALPQKIAGGTGAPTRILAVMESTN